MLPAEAALQDPARARVLLEQAIRDGSPRHADLRILRCRPRVARNNPGSRVTVVYDLDYARADRGHGWPPVCPSARS